MLTEQSLTSDISHIAPVDYEWGAIKWLCNDELMPDCQQSFGPQGVKHLLKNNGWEPVNYVASFSASFRGTVFTEASTPAQPAARVY